MSKGKETSWLTIVIFLAIPFLRIFGTFMLIKKISGLISLSKKQTDLVYALAAILLFTSAGEIFSIVRNTFFMSILPVSAVAIAIVLLIRAMNKHEDRLDNYTFVIGGRDSVEIDEITSAMGVSEKKLRRDIRALKKKGKLPKNAYIDEGRRILIVDPHLYRQAETAQKAEKADESSPETEYKHILLEIRALNVMIDDEMVSKKIDRIEEITSSIFSIVSSKPERRREIDTFMEYYLPTTLKLLKQYAHLEHQTVTGDNIASSRARIEGILDKLVLGFEKQLDILFKSDAVDITSDIKTLEQMLKMDGLAR